MKKWSVLAASLVLILSFQNCTKVMVPISDSSSSNNIVVDTKQTPAAEFSILTVAKYPSAANSNYTYYKIDIASGGVEAVQRKDDGQEVSSALCLSADEKSALDSILKDAMVCQPVINFSAVKDQVCTMDYKYPYATLSNGREEMRLGEKTSGCDVPNDLCGAKAQDLSKFVQNLLITIDSRSCN